jgi:hypothetical protein
VLWAGVSLLAIAFHGHVGPIVEAIGYRLYRTIWVGPLAAAVSVTVLTSRPARHRWPERSRRVDLGLVLLATVYGFIAAAGGLLQALLVLGLMAIVGLLIACVMVLPQRLAPPLPTEMLDALSERDRVELTDSRLKLQNDLRTTALQAIGGLAILAGAALGFQQLAEDRQQAIVAQDLTRQGQASERFTRAIDQLDSDRTEVQLGGGVLPAS